MKTILVVDPRFAVQNYSEWALREQGYDVAGQPNRVLTSDGVAVRYWPRQGVPAVCQIEGPVEPVFGVGQFGNPLGSGSGEDNGHLVACLLELVGRGEGVGRPRRVRVRLGVSHYHYRRLRRQGVTASRRLYAPSTSGHKKATIGNPLPILPNVCYDLARRAANVASAAPATAPRFAAGCVSSQVMRLLESDSPPKSPPALS